MVYTIGMMNSTEAIRRAFLADRERALKAKIAALDPDTLDRFGLTTPELIARHIADEMADEAEALGL